MSEVDPSSEITFHLEDESQATYHANLYRSSPQTQLHTVSSTHKVVIPSSSSSTSSSSSHKDKDIIHDTPFHTITSPSIPILSPSSDPLQQKHDPIHSILSPSSSSSSHPISPPTHSRTLSSHPHSYDVDTKYSSSPPKCSIPVLTSRAPDLTITSTSTSTSTTIKSRSIHIAQLESTTNLADSLRQQVECHQQALREMELFMDDHGKSKKKLSGTSKGKIDGSLSNSSQTRTLLTAGSISSTPSPSQAVRTIRNETNCEPTTSSSTPAEPSSIPEKSRCHCICM